MELETEEDGKKHRLKTGSGYLITMGILIFLGTCLFVFREEARDYVGMVLQDETPLDD